MQQIVLVRILKIYRTVKWAILTEYIVSNTFIGQSFATKGTWILFSGGNRRSLWRKNTISKLDLNNDQRCWEFGIMWKVNIAWLEHILDDVDFDMAVICLEPNNSSEGGMFLALETSNKMYCKIGEHSGYQKVKISQDFNFWTFSLTGLVIFQARLCWSMDFMKYCYSGTFCKNLGHF